MRRSKEIMILLVLLVAAMGFVLWYVIDRRARNRAAAAPAAGRTLAPAPPVDLTQHDGQTIDFSTGQPVVKHDAENQAAVAAAVQDIQAATAGVTFKAGSPSPAPGPPPATP